MSFIEGVGDEVTVVAVLMLIIILVVTIFFSDFSSGFNVASHFGQTDHQLQAPVVSEQQSETSSSNNVTDTDSVNAKSENSEDVTETTFSLVDEQQQSEALDCTSSDPPSASLNGNVEGDLCDSHSENIACKAESGLTNEQENVSQEEPPVSPNMFRIRLKYLNDTERTVTTERTQKIKEFKRVHFADDVANNRIVRLIFNGQLLRDNLTIEQFGILDRSVVHVQISNAPSPQQTATDTDAQLDLSNFFWPLFAVILLVCWISYMQYPQYFNVPSIVLLIVFTISFVIVIMHSSIEVF